MELLTSNNPRPFLRWAGGKKWFIKNFASYLPKKINNYHETFLGSGSCYFSLPKEYYKQSYLSDMNEDLINAYIQIRDNLEAVLEELKLFKNNKTTYYRVREKDLLMNTAQSAARMIYLNKTGFNGLYRVNSEGRFNVPYGYRLNIDIAEEDNLRKVSTHLQGTTIDNIDFRDACKKVKKGDFVFLDPPYTVAHNHNGFIEYNQKIFSWEDQEKLQECVEIINKKRAFFLMTNACHPSIKELYENVGTQIPVERYSTISGHMGSRMKISELIITNCLSS